MIFFLEITLSLYSLAAIFFSGLLVSGLIFVSRARSLKAKINELEKEMLSNHAEILQLHREKVQLLEKIQDAPLSASGKPQAGETIEWASPTKINS